MDEDTKRKVLRKLPYGMYVMTASAGGDVAASTLTWLSQCSFGPPLVMLADQASRKRAVYVIVDNRTGQAAGSSSYGNLAEADRRLEIGWSWLARVTDAIRRGDHTVFVAEVIHAGLREPSAPALLLASTPWNYGG